MGARPRCAEHLSGATCDEGRPLEELRKDLPWAVNWKGLAELPEEWWTEARPEEALRVSGFLQFLQDGVGKLRDLNVFHGISEDFDWIWVLGGLETMARRGRRSASWWFRTALSWATSLGSPGRFRSFEMVPKARSA